MKFPTLFKRSAQDAQASKLIDAILMAAEGANAAGMWITPESSQRVAAVYSCITAISETLAMLPAAVFEEASDKKKNKLKDHPLYPVIHRAPNSYMDCFQFFEMAAAHICEDGNHYSLIVRDGGHGVKALMPIHYTAMESVKPVKGRLQYKYRDSETNELTVKDQSEILHIRHRSKDGIKGRSPITVAADTVGFSMAVAKHGVKTFEHGAFTPGYLKVPVVMKDDEGRQNLIDSFMKAIKGVNNSGKIGLIEGEGIEFKSVTMNNRDAQFVELTEMSALGIAQIFRVPPHMIQMLKEGTSYASVEQMAIWFVNYTLQPWMTRFEAAMKFQLLNLPGEEELFIKFNESALLRGDMKSRTEAIVQQLQYGLKTINEGRSLLDDNPADTPLADAIMISHNLRPIEQLEKELEAQDAAEPEDTPKDDQEDTQEGETGQPTGDKTQPTEDPTPAFNDLFANSMDHLLALERKAINRAAKKETFLKEMNDFYRDFSEILFAELKPIAVAYCRVSGLKFDSNGLAAWVERFISHGSDQILAGKKDACRGDSLGYAETLSRDVKILEV